MSKLFHQGVRALRKGRFSCSGQAYFITTVCKARMPIFADKSAADLSFGCLMQAQTWPDAHCLGWVLMPDHLHLLIVLGEHEPLWLAIQRVKSLIAARVNQQRGIREPIWQRGFHDHAIAATVQIHHVVHYMQQNPVRAGLAECPDDYPYHWYSPKFKNHHIL